MEGKTDTRSIALNMLSETLDKGIFSGRVTEGIFEDPLVEDKDRAFILRLYFGTLERLTLLDYNICAVSNTPFDKIRPVIKNILRLSLYQMFFMDSVPERAAVSEALRLVQKRGLSGLKGYVNALLRNIQRNGPAQDLPDHVKACVPEWIYDRVCTDIGRERAEGFFRTSLAGPGGLYACLNTAVCSRERIFDGFKKEGIEFSETSMPGIYKIRSAKKIESLKAFKRGYFYIQSPNSVRVCRAAERFSENKEDPFIMDICAAPGGKSADLAMSFPGADILACDKSAAKTERIKENILRLGLKNITTRVFDGRVFDKKYEAAADIVIADLPCSGLGVIGTKPDIKHRLIPEDINSLSRLQREILRTSSGYVKAGGLLIYSTCTLCAAENTDNAAWFEKEAAFTRIFEKQYLTFDERADGFYVAVFRKN